MRLAVLDGKSVKEVGLILSDGGIPPLSRELVTVGKTTGLLSMLEIVSGLLVIFVICELCLS